MEALTYLIALGIRVLHSPLIQITGNVFWGIVKLFPALSRVLEFIMGGDDELEREETSLLNEASESSSSSSTASATGTHIRHRRLHRISVRGRAFLKRRLIGWLLGIYIAFFLSACAVLYIEGAKQAFRDLGTHRDRHWRCARVDIPEDWAECRMADDFLKETSTNFDVLVWRASSYVRKNITPCGTQPCGHLLNMFSSVTIELFKRIVTWSLPVFALIWLSLLVMDRIATEPPRRKVE